jgi:molybdate transport system substrate-binding protein
MRLARDIRALVVAAIAMAGCATACAAAPSPPAIAAASDLSFALTEIADQFARDHGDRVSLVFGSSGVLTRQIRDGAPFELFLSADDIFVDQLAAAGFTRDRGVPYALGRIVLFAPAGSPLVPADGLDGLGRLFRGGQAGRVAIANPEHAPYGRAAEAALRAHGLWDAVLPHVVLGENVSQAVQFATTGSTIGGIIAYSLALAPPLKGRGTYALIPAGDHPPLRQQMVLLKRAGAVADRFYRYLQEPEARAILQRYGFALPD